MSAGFIDSLDLKTENQSFFISKKTQTNIQSNKVLF